MSMSQMKKNAWHYFSWHPERSNSLWFVFFAFTYKKSASWQLELGIQPEAAIYTPFLFLGHDILLLYSYLTITSSLVSLFRNCSALLNARLEIRIPDVPFLYERNCIDYSDSSIVGPHLVLLIIASLPTRVCSTMLDAGVLQKYCRMTVEGATT